MLRITCGLETCHHSLENKPVSVSGDCMSRLRRASMLSWSFLLWFRNRIPYRDEPDPGITSFGRDCAVVLPTGSVLCRIPKLWFHCLEFIMHSHRGKDGLAGPTALPCPGVVSGSPVRGNGSPLSVRVGRSPVVPSGCGNCPPIRHLGWKSSVPSWPGVSGSEGASCRRPDHLRSHDCEHCRSGPGQRGVRHASCDGVEGLPPVVLRIQEGPVPDQAADSDGVHEDEGAHPRAALPRVRFQGSGPCSGGCGCRFCRMMAFLRYCPARGGRRRPRAAWGCLGQTSRRGVRSVAHPWIWARLAARL